MMRRTTALAVLAWLLPGIDGAWSEQLGSQLLLCGRFLAP
jgi:hypothetical protein